MCSFLVAGLSVLSARLIQIQLVDRQQYAASARKAFHRTEVLTATRGMIVDRREEPIAKSIPVSTVYVDKTHLLDPKLASYGVAYQELSSDPEWNALTAEEKRRKISSRRGEILTAEKDNPEIIVRKHLAYAVGILARPLGMRHEELYQKIETSKGKWFPIAKELPQDVADQLRDAISASWIQGFEFENSIKRWYTSPDLATHLTGFTGEVEETDDEGKKHTKVNGRFGVEKSMDSYLTGRNGFRKHVRDARGLVVPGEESGLIPPRAGLNVKLTIDMGLQNILEEELDAGLKEFGSKRGTVVLMDPKTGEVLGMASRPHFNLNTKKNLAESSFNYAIQTIYEPGSTLKVVATSGALNEGLVRPTTSIFCHNGFYQGKGFTVKDQYPAGSLSFEGVLQKSNNIGTYSLGRQLGSKRFYNYLHRYGFGSKTGILLSGESAGVARDTKNESDFSRACYGYATAVTPLQLASAYSVIAGDGKLRKPSIVKSVVANDGSIIEEFPPEVVNEVLKPRSAALMRAALEKVVLTGGTATRAAVPGFRVAGKTGTARKHKKGGYHSDKYIVSFAGMMPAQDPAFVCVVVIDEPVSKVKAGGGTMAAPVFSKIATRVAAFMNLQPTEPLPAPIASSSR